MTQRILWIFLALCLAGCGGPTDEDKMHGATEQERFHLDSEQVTLTPQQVGCGVDKDLWDEPETGSGRSIARLKQGGRDLGFTDDVSIENSQFLLPYTQIRGDFMLGFDSLVDVKDGPQGTKTVQARVRAKVAHDCFMGGLPIMGILKGQFKQDAPVVLVFTVVDSENWHLERIVH